MHSEDKYVFIIPYMPVKWYTWRHGTEMEQKCQNRTCNKQVAKWND